MLRKKLSSWHLKIFRITSLADFKMEPWTFWKVELEYCILSPHTYPPLLLKYPPPLNRLWLNFFLMHWLKSVVRVKRNLTLNLTHNFFRDSGHKNKNYIFENGCNNMCYILIFVKNNKLQDTGIESKSKIIKYLL